MMKRYKALVVDDAEMFQKIYKSILLADGFKVFIANNGAEALKSVMEDKPDIMLLDINMPIMDGYKVLEHVKSNDDLASIPILVLSSRGQPEEIEKAMDLGADGYLIKTTSKPKEVVAKIKEVLERQEE
ncbi:MAG TPA: response regulator [Nitrospirae bacterium]|nr:transcriptional regulatory protein PrrA [bacterium BMS3Abin10]GBE37554.1 transcriptional regulatory protein PrrA [bacterium BMS3Bbin08]HDH50876.1 response regulator [Nitrospirota bacterium]HDK16540.1 response regulator [Nitrospirota bacterium]HDK82262.1 response regulator [Nitrospirota bacterium]